MSTTMTRQDRRAPATAAKATPAPVSGPVLLARALKYLCVLLLMVLYLFPLAFLINTALKSNADFFANPGGIAKSFEFGNFIDAWQKGNFSAYLLNSILYTTVATLLSTFVSLLIAFPVSRGYIRHAKLWYGVMVAMLFLPNALMTQFQLVLRLHLYDSRLGYILMMASGIGVGPLLLTGYIKSVPKEMDEAAALDGVGYWRFLLRILPFLIRPALATVLVLQGIGIWNDIIMATILLPDQAKSPMTLGLFAFQGTHSSQWSLLAAATIIVAAPLVVSYVFLQRFIVGSVSGAVKG